MGTLNEFTYVYVRGPNGERIEVRSGLEHFRHLHFMTPNVDEAVAGYQAFLEVEPLMPQLARGAGLVNSIALDGAQLDFLSVPVIDTFVETDVNRPATSRSPCPTSMRLYARAQRLGLTIFSPPSRTEFGLRSFFVRAPQFALPTT